MQQNSVLRNMGGEKHKETGYITVKIGGAGVILRCRRLGLKSGQNG